MTTVTLRKRLSKGKDKIYLYLDYYPALFNPRTRKTCCHEYLGMFLYANPDTNIKKMYNERIWEQAEAIRCKKNIDIVNGTYDFRDKTAGSADFLAYYRNQCENHDGSWRRSYYRFRSFVHGKCRFSDLTVKLCQEFSEYLQNEACSIQHGKEGCKLHPNTVAKFYIIFRRVLKDAYKDRYLTDNINDYLEYIPYVKTHREYLTIDEVRRLHDTPCVYEPLRNAVMFSIFTGLRKSDILDLEWEDIVIAPDGKPCIRKVIQKTQTDATVFISEEALSYCGERSEGRVFKDFRPYMTGEPLKRWLRDAGIDKHITFHSMRHTNATLMIAGGADIYTVSGQLVHADIKTTQIYTNVIDLNKRKASEIITLK